MGKKEEQTFIMVKPDGVQRGLIHTVIQRFEQRGYKLVAMKMMMASVDLLTEHYGHLSHLPFFNGLIQFMSADPVVAMVWEGLDVVAQGRLMLGETQPTKSLPGTLRGDYCIDVGRNLVHGSDSVDTASREIALWFSAEEMCKWDATAYSNIYEV